MKDQDPPIPHPRQGWAEAFERLGDDDLLDDEIPEEWLKPAEELDEHPPGDSRADSAPAPETAPPRAM